MIVPLVVPLLVLLPAFNVLNDRCTATFRVGVPFGGGDMRWIVDDDKRDDGGGEIKEPTDDRNDMTSTQETENSVDTHRQTVFHPVPPST
jgi:hypothetical protein